MAADTYIENVIQYNHSNDTDTLYGIVRNIAKEIRDVANGNFEAHPASGSLDDYDISAGVASGGLWSGSFPEITNGFYIYQIRLRAGATPDFADIVLGAVKGYWNGAVFAEFNVDAAGRIDLGKWLGVAPLALTSQYVQTDAKKINGNTPMTLAQINAEVDTAISEASLAPASEYDTEMARITADVGTEAKQDTIAAYLDTEIAAILAAVDTEVAFIKNVMEGDVSIDITTTPWQAVVKIKSTDTELIRKDLKDKDGNNITSVNAMIGQYKEP